MKAHFIFTSLVLICATQAIAGPPPPPPPLPRYFPLDLGNLWSYVDPARPDASLHVRVVDIKDGLTVVDFYGTQALIQDRGDELDISLPDVGLVSYYRFNEKFFLHRDVFSCNDDRMLDFSSNDEVVVTPAGTFTNCLRLDYEVGHCSDSGRTSEWWSLDTGLVKWTEDSFTGPRVHLLQSFEHGVPTPTFRRGDADGDASIGLTDAVFTLNYLFSGSRAPDCQDAADSNDDGSLNIGDPIFLLGYLFLGSPPPPAPGPDACGEDPTADALPTCEFPACHQGFGT